MDRRVILLFLCITMACVKVPDGGEDPPAPSLTVLIGTDGYGDGSYNDNMLTGILRFKKAHPEIRLTLRQPGSIADAETQLDDWLAAESDAPRALILASNTYKPLLRGKPAPKSGRVLILESDESFPGHSSYIIRRYGASWLCGAMSAAFHPFVIKAMDGNDMIDESARGFSEGFHHVAGEDVTSRTLADGPEGFAMRDSTYRFLYKLMQETTVSAMPLVFPLLGGSISGVFDYSRYMGFILIAGMDVDCSSYNPYVVPYSLLVKNDCVLEGYLEDWLRGNAWPEHAEFGLESGNVDVLVNPAFAADGNDLRALKDQYLPLAMEKEAAYEVE